MSHHCHAYKCATPCPPEMFMCKAHWFALPMKMRRAIWTSYRSGQCDDMKPSTAYCCAAYDAVRWLAEQEGHKLTLNEPALMLYVRLSDGFGLV